MIIIGIIIIYFVAGVLFTGLLLAAAEPSGNKENHAMVAIAIWPLAALILLLTILARISIAIANNLKRRPKQ